MNEKADRTLSHILRNLPPRPAPATLESRVLQQLQHRRALAWWWHGFAHWPAAARAGFITTCIVLIGASLPDTGWSMLRTGVLQRVLSWAMSWAYPAAGAIASTTAVSTRIVHAVPADWLYAILAMGAALYAALFGLGLAAYRTLYLSSPPRQEIR